MVLRLQSLGPKRELPPLERCLSDLSRFLPLRGGTHVLSNAFMSPAWARQGLTFWPLMGENNSQEKVLNKQLVHYGRSE